MDDWLDHLNPKQRAAAIFGSGPGEDCPLLVIAGAGSGKTTTLAHRVAYLISEGVHPSRILLLTFTRRAAAEMTRQAERIIGRLPKGKRSAPARITWSGTFHGIGARLLRGYATRLGLRPNFTIHDQADSADLLNLVRSGLGLADKTSRFPMKGTCLKIYSKVINTQQSLDETLRLTFPWCIQWEADLRELFEAYVTAKQDQDVLDYDDLLSYWAELVRIPDFASEIGDRFDHVLIDEYQDTNRLQASIIRAMKPRGAGVTAVGDDAQSIYSFRAATVRNIRDFPSAFATPGHVITLEQNYRSTQPILSASNAVIGLAPERFTKDLWSNRRSDALPQLVSILDDAAQAEFIVENILANREAGILLHKQAVLFRASHHSASLELELTRRNIPFVKFGGLKFLEAAHVKDAIALLRWTENMRDRVAGFRVLQLIPGIGPRFAESVLEAVTTSRDRMTALRGVRASSRSQSDWDDFLVAVDRLYHSKEGWPAELTLVREWYEPHLERIHDDAPARIADLFQLEQIAASFPSRQRFLTELTLDPPNAISDRSGAPVLDEDCLVLSTIHSAKGQEWSSVFVLNCIDGCIPSDRSAGRAEEIEEERRLLYVAMTRAKDQLALMVPQRYYLHRKAGVSDAHLYPARTSFLPDELLPFFEVMNSPSARMSSLASTADFQQDIGASMRPRWK